MNEQEQAELNWLYAFYGMTDELKFRELSVLLSNLSTRTRRLNLFQPTPEDVYRIFKNGFIRETSTSGSCPLLAFEPGVEQQYQDVFLKHRCYETNELIGVSFNRASEHFPRFLMDLKNNGVESGIGTIKTGLSVFTFL